MTIQILEHGELKGMSHATKLAQRCSRVIIAKVEGLTHYWVVLADGEEHFYFGTQESFDGWVREEALVQ